MKPETSETTTMQTLEALMTKKPPFVSRKDHKKDSNQVELGYTITTEGQDRIKEFQPEIDAYDKHHNPIEKKSWPERHWLLLLIITGVVTYAFGIMSPIFTDMVRVKYPELTTPESTQTNTETDSALKGDTSSAKVTTPSP